MAEIHKSKKSGLLFKANRIFIGMINNKLCHFDEQCAGCALREEKSYALCMNAHLSIAEDFSLALTPILYACKFEMTSFLSLIHYFAFTTTVAGLNPADVAVSVTSPATPFDWIMASAKPWKALR